MAGGQTRRVVLGDLPLAEKERFYEFLVANKVEFVADGAGECFVATIRVVPPEPNTARITGRQRQPLSGRMRKGPETPGKAQTRSKSQGAEKADPIQDTAATLKAAQSVLRRRYTRFCNLLPSLQSPPKALRAAAIIRFADEVYEARYEKDAQFIRTQASGQDVKLPQTFPEFVYEFCAKRYGLKQLVSNNCWGMVSSVELIRGQDVGIDLFGRFLEESYDTTDLLFFLFMRSSVEKVIAQSKKGPAADSEEDMKKEEEKKEVHGSKRAQAKASRAQEAKKTHHEGPKEIRLDAKQCILVVRQSIESKRQELRDNILRKIDAAMAARTDSSSRKSPTLEPERLMAIATEEYHNSRDASGEAAAGASAAEGALMLDGTPAGNLPKDKDLDPAIRKEVKQVTQRLIASLSAQGETEINQQQVYEWALQVTLRRHKLGDFLDQDPSHMADPFSEADFLGRGGHHHQEAAQKALVPAYEDVLNLPPEEFERNLEANVRQLLLAATSDLVTESVENLPPGAGRVWKDEKNLNSLKTALVSEFAPTADIIMEAIVSKDFGTWLKTLKIDGGGTSRHRQIFQRLHDEFQEVLTAEITAEAVLQICRGVVSAEELSEQVRARAMELSKGPSQGGAQQDHASDDESDR
mmetsp:Transcript_36827/g.64885  ORF Transcript_36827/g.64885 Transcript_36827/m.64885 type:complete len:639 (+) Transcript_36827:78-1994(+)